MKPGKNEDGKRNEKHQQRFTAERTLYRNI